MCILSHKGADWNKGGACAMVLLALLLALFQAPAHSEEVLVNESEDISARNQTTRVYHRTYECQTTDEAGNPITQTPTGNDSTPSISSISSIPFPQTRQATVVEKADGLCYDAALSGPEAGPPQWTPTVTDFARLANGGWAVETGPAKVYVAPRADASPLATYSVPFRGALIDPADPESPTAVCRVDLALGGCRLAYTDASGARVAVDNPRAVPGVAEGNRASPNAGAFACGDLEVVYEKGAFHLNVVVRDPARLPDPASLGLDPATARLAVETEVQNQSASSEVAATLTGDSLSFQSVLTDSEAAAASAAALNPIPGEPAPAVPEPPVVSFGASAAFSSDAPAERTPMESSTTVLDAASGSYLRTDSVDFSAVTEQSPGATLVLDPVVRTGTATLNEAWQPGVTYHVSSSYTIPSGKTLAIEGGAVVKINAGAYIQIDNGAQILARGTKFNYAIFAPTGENAVGEVLPPSSGPPTAYFYFRPCTAPATLASRIEYCKFGATGAWGAIAFELLGGAFNYPVANCIFRGGDYGVFSASDANGTFRVYNCLFAGQTQYGVLFAPTNSGATLYVVNCTLDGGGQGSWGVTGIHSVYTGSTVYIVNNMISKFNQALVITASGASVINHTREYNCPTADSVTGPVAQDTSDLGDPQFLRRMSPMPMARITRDSCFSIKARP